LYVPLERFLPPPRCLPIRKACTLLLVCNLKNMLTMITLSQRSDANFPICVGDQFGAVWVSSTDTTGVKFGYASIPGVGAPSADIPQAAQDVIKIDPSVTAWTLSVPSPTVGKYHIAFGIGTPSSSVTAGPTTAAVTWTKGACTITYAQSPRSFDSSLQGLMR